MWEACSHRLYLYRQTALASLLGAAEGLSWSADKSQCKRALYSACRVHLFGALRSCFAT